jgi:hypothetical protein
VTYLIVISFNSAEFKIRAVKENLIVEGPSQIFTENDFSFIVFSIGFYGGI